MNSLTKFALLACLGLTIAAVPRPAAADEIAARLDALEKENSALRARLNRLEASKTGKLRATSLGSGIEPGAGLVAATAKRGRHGHGSQLQKRIPQ